MELIEQFNGLKALVVGDVMIDAYSKGVVERMSPEAPVPIVDLSEHFNRLGGAANVAINLKALGAIPTICSVIGDDSHADDFLALMREHGLATEGLIKSGKRVTTVKHRVFNGDKQLLRIDEENTFDLTEDEYSELFQIIENQIETTDIILLQDYNKGVLSEKMIKAVIGLAKDRHIPVAVDPKKKNFFAYQGVTLFKPNAKELRDGLGVTAETIDELRKASQSLQERLQCKYLMVTLSEQGVMILRDGEFHHLPAHPRHIVDVSGAGDTVLSVAALCVASFEKDACDASLHQNATTIAAISNLAGGLVCEEVGVVPINKEKLLQEVKRIQHE
jgi:rfaE bifunctional protein kinase chain/domain